ncbi:Gfo/Idh/MocA family protein [Ammoniphilus sp. YIM 78166]|uniref:Gfo/Idh/MocA family protein n=1 Tax=Ammoniphilus sp. YIM 78166 TaxID=1644106 RepID=UPI001070549F|nr:Gfo/Idh/MocA family oxidoreductase [Ammoniphilus sp. YIM 78166]
MPVQVAIIGAGDRGNTYSRYALHSPHEMEVVAVAEPNPVRRESFVQNYDLADDKVFSSWEDLLAQPKFCDAVLVTTQDQMHYGPTIQALRQGYAVLVEKPMSPNVDECLNLIDTALETTQQLMLGYVLRFTPFIQKIKQLLNDNIIGDIRHISLDVNVAYWHFAHSFVRGNWRRSDLASPMILAKCCHDFDILLHLINQRCTQISSFGSLVHFKQDKAPPGSTEHCLSGCQIEESCPYSAKSLYLGENIGWPVSTITQDLSLEGRRKALKEGPYGRCVYRCDNDVVDHQTVLFQFEKGATATLTMSAFTKNLTRMIRILGSEGEISGEMEKNEIHVTRFGELTERIGVNPASFGLHAGGDFGLIQAFVKQVREQARTELQDFENIFMSHQLAALAEESRITGKTMEVNSRTGAPYNWLLTFGPR